MRAGLGDITAAECCRWPGAGASPGGLQLLQSLSPWTPGTLGLMTIRSSVHYQVRRHEEGSRVVVMETSDASPLSTARISPQPPAAEQRSVIGGRRRETVRLLAAVETVATGSWLQWRQWRHITQCTGTSGHQPGQSSSNSRQTGEKYFENNVFCVWVKWHV